VYDPVPSNGEHSIFLQAIAIGGNQAYDKNCQEMVIFFEIFFLYTSLVKNSKFIQETATVR